MTFDIISRAAAGRIGRFTTPHGAVTTPTMMPVVNPNIDLVPPKEMAQRFGAEMIITNSYVIHKHDHLRKHALENGVHDLVDWDGALMTDSGTFQMYVYGDVEVGPEEIVQFQADMGVDVATCLDLFVTPDMTREEAEQAVATTLERTAAASKQRTAWRAEPDGRGRGANTPYINATVQGGLHMDLRQACAGAHRELDTGYTTIGGVVPVMEQQMYPELVDIILNAQQHLRKDRPVHLFGAGHPLVFPLATALGCDLFDSSSYAKYAKDGRMMWEGGTLHVADLDEWPVHAPMLDGWTPKELSKALKQKRRRAGVPDDADRTYASAQARIRQKEAESPGFAAERALALHNLDVCFTDLRRIRTAIRDGVLWELVEQRAACHPLLAAATRRLRAPEYQAWLEQREPLSGGKAMRYTGGLTHNRPVFHRIKTRMQERFTPIGEPVEAQVSTPYAEEGEEKREVAMHKEPANKPFGPALARKDGGDERARKLPLDEEQDHVVISSLGPVPLGLDEAYPFAQSVLPALGDLDQAHMGWVGTTKDAFLEAHDFMPGIPGPPGPKGGFDRDLMQVLRTADWQFGAGAGHALTDGNLKCERSKATGKMRTVHLNGEHILSLRAQDALFTLKPAGAKILHAAGIPMRVTVHDDSVAFNREGKSAFAKFIVACDEGLRPGDECLIVDGSGDLVAVGQALMNAEEMLDFENGVAVKVRDGIA
ncbi:MAG: tRNA guanosine(15) transglycosylase TgtA [Thermoplasmatota archaeon]